MKGVICRQAETHPGQVTVTLPRGDSTIIFKLVVPGSGRLGPEGRGPRLCTPVATRFPGIIS